MSFKTPFGNVMFLVR